MKKFKERMNRKFKLYSLNIILLVLIISLLSNCQENNSYEFDNYKLNKKNNIKIALPKGLDEISGLAYLGDNNIITHNDEYGIVYKIKLPLGEVINKFILGDKLASEDFEGIAVVGETLFLVTSSGDLYKYPGFAAENFAQFEKIKTGLNADSQKPIKVYYDNEIVGDFVADIIVNDTIILELKSVRRIIRAHEVQLVNYLVATKKSVGLLLNFGERKVDVKRKIRILE